MPRRRVSVAVVPKFNALNLPGQAPSSSPIPSLPALVSIMSPAFCQFLHFSHTTATERMQMGTGSTGTGNFQQRLWMEVHKATQRKPCHCSETRKPSTEGSGGVLQNSHPFEQKCNSLRRGCLKKPAKNFAGFRGSRQLYLKLWFAESELELGLILSYSLQPC